MERNGLQFPEQKKKSFIWCDPPISSHKFELFGHFFSRMIDNGNQKKDNSLYKYTKVSFPFLVNKKRRKNQWKKLRRKLSISPPQSKMTQSMCEPTISTQS